MNEKCKVIASYRYDDNIDIIVTIHGDFEATDDNGRIEKAFEKLYGGDIFDVKLNTTFTLDDFKNEFDFAFE
jgi:hypothetical protein